MFEMVWVDLACSIATFLQPRIIMQKKLKGLGLPSCYTPFFNRRLHFCEIAMFKMVGMITIPKSIAPLAEIAEEILKALRGF
jgi:hypothetical protein